MIDRRQKWAVYVLPYVNSILIEKKRVFTWRYSGSAKWECNYDPSALNSKHQTSMGTYVHTKVRNGASCIYNGLKICEENYIWYIYFLNILHITVNTLYLYTHRFLCSFFVFVSYYTPALCLLNYYLLVLLPLQFVDVCTEDRIFNDILLHITTRMRDGWIRVKFSFVHMDVL